MSAVAGPLSIKSSSTNNGLNHFNIFTNLRYEYLVAGVAGGTISTLVLHPLDLLKVRFAVHDGQSKVAPRYTGVRHAVRHVLQTEGIKGLYQGMIPNVLGSGASWGIYFLIYNSVKTWIQDGDTTKSLGPWMHMVAATDAGVLTLMVTNPIWVVKTRLCLQYAQDDLPESKRYYGMKDCVKKILANEGPQGLYRGFLPGLFGVSHGAIQFMAYEEMKEYYNIYRSQPINTKLGAIEYIACAAVSKVVAAATTYPYQVLRARLQDQHHNYRGTLDCTKRILKYEGISGFYKGLSVNLIRVTPATVITFVVYEYMMQLLFSTNPMK